MSYTVSHRKGLFSAQTVFVHEGMIDELADNLMGKVGLNDLYEINRYGEAVAKIWWSTWEEKPMVEWFNQETLIPVEPEDEMTEEYDLLGDEEAMSLCYPNFLSEEKDDYQMWLSEEIEADRLAEELAAKLNWDQYTILKNCETVKAWEEAFFEE